MYEAHFGLNSRPFGAKAEGPQIFTGPQQVKVIQGVQKGLLAQDAVVTVSGPIGAGKTTIVSKALETVKPNRMAAWIGRMTLAQDEILDLLLAGFGVRQQVNGSVRRFALFRRIMAERAAAGAAVAIVVEDAIRLGADTLAELEALTAADTGDAIGANIILMGPPDLSRFLSEPGLARLKQRVRRRESVAAFSQAEVTGYLKHCMRQAGGDYDALFEPGVDQIIFRCSEGVPRVINTLCENVLTAAMEAGQTLITTGLMHEVASDNYTYEGPPPDFADAPDIDWEAAPATEAVAERPAGNDPLAIDEEDLPPAARNIVVESGRYPELPDVPSETSRSDVEPLPAQASGTAANSKPMPEAKPSAQAIPDSKSSSTTAAHEEERASSLPDTGPESRQAVVDVTAEPAIPELINDTQPELSALSAPLTDEAVEPPAPPVVEQTTAAEPARESSSSAIREVSADVDTAAAKAQALNAPGAQAAAVEDKPGAPAEAATDEPEPDEDENFDLDAALSIDVDDTNVMQGITPNLDALGKDNPVPPVAEAATPKSADDDLPTLSNSMRVDIDKEVKRARKADATAKPATPAPKPEEKPAKAEQPVSRSAERQAPARGEQVPDPGKEPNRVPADAARIRASEDAQAESPATEADGPVSEMTARIRSIDIGKRSNDVDSLEAALEAAKKGNLEDLTSSPAASSINGAKSPPPAPAPQLPEITLDKELEEKQQKKRQELEKYAREISSANSLEEFSDAMAETLFGNEEFEAIAAEVVANPPDDHELADPPPAGPSPVLLDDAASTALELEAERTGTAGAAQAPGGTLRDSQAMRADMLTSLKGAAASRTPAAPVAEKIELGQPPSPSSPPSASESQPESIEDQMDTVMTQTLAALDISKMSDQVVPPETADEKPKKKSGGLFSRFRKSS